MQISDAVRRTPRGLEADILVSPKSSRRALEGVDPWRKRLIVKVRAPPVEGKADEDVCGLFEEITGCRTEILSGAVSRQKTVLISGDPQKIERSLEEALEKGPD
ncbi:MAG: DUF167 domain-containing protein [Methanomethylophilus sp.]|jgi:uncharacterized protein (TIGR00251 family)